MKPYPLAPLNHLTVPFSFTNATPFASSSDFESPLLTLPVEKRLLSCARGKLSARSGQSLAVFRHNPDCTKLALPGDASTACKSTNPERARRDDRRELRMIFRNSGSCKVICFGRHGSLRLPRDRRREGEIR